MRWEQLFPGADDDDDNMQTGTCYVEDGWFVQTVVLKSLGQNVTKRRHLKHLKCCVFRGARCAVQPDCWLAVQKANS